MLVSMKRLFVNLCGVVYRALRPVLFLTNSETIHEFLVNFGGVLGAIPPVRRLFYSLWVKENPMLTQNILGIEFENPIGLATGFDYKAKLTRILPFMGFGFGTVGTITNNPYEGNPRPMLGRLVKSRALLVNKGFKNDGVDAVVRKFKNTETFYPVGLSIGKTNSKETATQEAAIADIIAAFKKAEATDLPFAYYELNISCPNLFGNVSFYPPGNLQALLLAVADLNLKKPLFIKMPITESDEDVMKMFEVIHSFRVDGVIFGNLQKDRSHPDLLPEEVALHGKGNFSGKPTEKRSNELIKLAYKTFGKKLVIIGCGGVFSAEDAYTKIKNGASLVQLITGLIFMGPQLAAQINLELPKLLKKDGFKNISEAVGADIK